MVGALPVASLHGRDDELRALDAVLDRVVSGRSTVLLLEGEAGIGKSRLLGEMLDRARGRDLAVVTGRGEDLERTRPFGVLADALGCRESSTDPALVQLAGLLSSHVSTEGGPVTVTSDPGLQFRVVDAFVDLVEAMAIRGPVVIGLDDLQWADPSTLLTLGAWSRRLGHLPVALVGCLRPAPRTPQLQRLLDALAGDHARRIALGPIDEDAVEALVSEAVEAPPSTRLLDEIGGAGGNPFFVTELLAAIREEGSLRTSDGQTDVTHVTLPPTLRLTILRRLGFLSEETMQALRAATILGSTFSLADLSTTTTRSVLELSETLREAIKASVLADEDGRLGFRHDLIRDAIYSDLPHSARLALHSEAGRRLAGRGAPARQVAEQLARGAVTGDREAVAWITAAAEEAAQRSPDIAVDLYGRVLELMHPTDPEIDRIRSARAAGLMSAGRVAEAEQACREVVDHTRDATAAGTARACLGVALLTSGRPAAGLAELERAARAEEIDRSDRARALGWVSIARLWLGHLDGASRAADEARAAAAGSGDELTWTIAASIDAVVALGRGRLSEAERLVDDALARADAAVERGGMDYPLHAPKAWVLVELDQFDEARFALDTGSRLSDQRGMHWHQASYLMAYAVQRYLAGEWEDAGDDADTSDELADVTGEGYHLIITRGIQAMLQLHRNDVAAAAGTARRALEQLTSTGARYHQQWAMLASGLVREAQGDLPGALAVLTEAWDQCAEMGLVVDFRLLGPELVRVALRCGDRDVAARAVAGLTDLAAANDVPSLDALVLRCRGLLEDDPALLEAAVDAYADSPRAVERAAAQEDAGAARLRRGDLPGGRLLLEEALETYAARGMLRDVARSEALLRSAGIRRGPKVSRGRPAFGWESLTPTEETVALLVAEGLSNPQIGDRLYVSRRTVQTHLGHVFAKLGISSRSHLAAEVTRRS
jgi:DNA-binding CsgD family transcriptional regulator/tetratricopeptide (TPR) repeat protein